MATFLFDQIIFGPVKSRRLGLSLGVNLLPTEQKLCNFNCIYCECGWSGKGVRPRFNKREDVYRLLENKLTEMVEQLTPPDVITFAGNGEPTMHPQFEEIIEDTIRLRDRIVPDTKISVLSNGTMIGRESVRRALLKVDNNIQKIDSAFDCTARLIDGVPTGYTIAKTVENLKKFNGKVIIQTMFLRGEFEGMIVDNTTDTEIEAWLALLTDIKPGSVMIYTLDRDTPAAGLRKVSVEELKEIAGKVRALGIECTYAG